MTDAAGGDTEGNLWRRMIAQNPGHSQWYIDRFKAMADRGDDIVGEARLVDAMVPREARVLDAGCGPGRIGGYLAAAGHRVVGVDLDPALIEAATAEHPGARWVCADLVALASPEGRAEHGVTEPFDAVICAGNVMTFLDPATRPAVLAGFAAVLDPQGRAAVGFGAGRGYEFDAFLADAEEAGLVPDQLLGTWDLRPFTADSDFLVALLRRR